MTPRSLLHAGRLAGGHLLRAQTDERLVELVRAGCTDGPATAFEVIVGRYRQPLLRYCTRLVTEERAEDAVQQTFLKAYEGLLRDNRAMALRPWLFRIAYNTSIDLIRSSMPVHEQLDERINGVERPDQAFERHQRLRDTLVAVEALPARQRDAIVLRELEGRSYLEIADELGVTGGAVRQLLVRARETLRTGASLLTPAGLLGRAGSGSGSVPPAESVLTPRLAELCGAVGTGAVAAKLGAATLVASIVASVAGGPAQAPSTVPAQPASAGIAADVRSAVKPDRGSPSQHPNTGANEEAAAGPVTDTKAPPAATPVASHPSRKPSSGREGSPAELGSPELGQDAAPGFEGVPSADAPPPRNAPCQGGYEGATSEQDSACAPAKETLTVEGTTPSQDGQVAGAQDRPADQGEPAVPATGAF